MFLSKFLMANSDRAAFEKKDKTLETLRGIAIILLVAFHARDFMDSDIYTFFVYVTDPIRMPLFAAVGGYLYAARPFKKNYFEFCYKKFNRVIVPAFTALILWFLLNILFTYDFQINLNNYTPAAIAKFFLFHPRTYWFVQAIFLVYAITAILDYLKLLKSPYAISFFILATHLIMITSYMAPSSRFLDFFSLSGAIYLIPHFLVGILLGRFDEFLTGKALITIIFIIFLTLYSFHIISYEGIELGRVQKRTSTIVFFISLTSVVLIFTATANLYLISIVGYFAFSIFLFHRFFFDIVNFLFDFQDMPQIMIAFTYCIFGVFAPIFIHRALLKSKLLAQCFLGVKIH